MVNFFLEHHSKDRVKEAVGKEIILVAMEDKELVATAALEKNHIKRMFVLPQYQGRGIGKRLIEALENIALEQGYTTTLLDSSIPGFGLYFKLGYLVKEYNSITVENEEVLCYHLMEKRIE